MARDTTRSEILDLIELALAQHRDDPAVRIHAAFHHVPRAVFDAIPCEEQLSVAREHSWVKYLFSDAASGSVMFYTDESPAAAREA